MLESAPIKVSKLTCLHVPLAAKSLTSKADWNALIFVASFDMEYYQCDWVHFFRWEYFSGIKKKFVLHQVDKPFLGNVQTM